MRADLESVHPELRRIARFIRPNTKPIKPSALRRGGLGEKLTTLVVAGRGKGVEVLRVNDDVTVRYLRPREGSSSGRAVLWIHGGGYVTGIAALSEKTSRALCQRLEATVASVEYRLAPEHPFPTPVEDCYAALLWLAKQPGVDPRKILIGGESAGGGLAAQLAQITRDRSEITLAGQILVYPMLDDRTALRTDLNGPYRLWPNVANHFGWKSYIGHEPGSPDVPKYAAAARLEDLSGLAPAWIGVGTEDLFHDEDVEYAKRLEAAGVRTRLEVVKGAFHAFDMLRRRAAVSRGFFDSQVAFAEACLTAVPA